MTVIHEEDLSPLMHCRDEAVLDRLERACSLHLGGIALERLHGSGEVRYRLLVARNDDRAMRCDDDGPSPCTASP
ncbi:MAG: hypothetical protein ACRD0K_10805 [Egibacteraceae bacterium]